MPDPDARPVVMDVTRLIWRAWRGRAPTGIDRVSLAYAAHYRRRALAAIQRDGFRRVLSPEASVALFELLLDRRGDFRAAFVRLIAAQGWRGPGHPLAGLPYLNVGHTGLDRPGLARWIARTGVRPIYMLHDLIPLTHPEYCAPGAPARHEARLERMLATGAGLIANSWDTMTALSGWAATRKLAIPPALVAWLGVELPLPGGDDAPLPEPYFVALGTIEGRKNHLLLFQIWRTLAERLGGLTPKLVLIGGRGWEAAQALAMLDRCPVLQGHVIELRGCDDETLSRYLFHARALLFPSFAEGFGLPLVEALMRAVPVVASDLPVFRELAGYAPLYRDPIDAVGWRDAVLELADDGPLGNRLRAAAARYQPPTWTAHFAQVDRWLDELIPPAALRAAGAVSSATLRTGRAAMRSDRPTAPARDRDGTL